MANPDRTRPIVGALRRRVGRLRQTPSSAEQWPPKPTGPPMPDGYSATAGLGFDDAMLESKLTWIWGTPRSGSTWLLKLLAYPLDPDPETALGYRPPRQGGPYDVVPIDESFLSNHLAPSLDDPRPIGDELLPATLNNYLSANKPAYVFSNEYEDVWRPEARRFGLVRIAGMLQRSRNAGIPITDDPEVVIKETNGSHAADLVMSLLPGSRLVLLIRDGRDVVDSLIAAYQPGAFLANNQGQSFGTPEKRAQRLRWAAELWACNIDSTIRAIDAHDPGRVIVVRYEDLLAETTSELRRVLDWMGIERDEAAIAETTEALAFKAIPEQDKGPLTRNRSAKPGLWRENLSEEEQATVHEILGRRLARFGYDD